MKKSIEVLESDAQVCFFISAIRGVNTKNGGYYRSLRQIANAMRMPYRIIVLGDFIPAPYEGLGNVKLVQQNRLSNHGVAKQLVDEVRGVAIFHSYSQTAAKVAMYLSAWLDRPLVVTKAGGPPWRRTVPVWRNMIVYQQADYDALKARRFGPRNIALIPQRVAHAPSGVGSLRRNPFARADIDKTKILCIGRFSDLHMDKILSAINLGRVLRGRGRPNTVSLVGTLQDKATFEYVREYLSPDDDVSVFTEREFKNEASELMVYADLVVASGRTVPEALQREKLIFVPVSGSDIPCLLTPENYAQSAGFNFTSRAPRARTLDPEQGLAEYLALDDARKTQLQEWARECFDTDHSAAVGAQRTEAFYAGLVGGERISACYVRAGWDQLKGTARRVLERWRRQV